MRRIQQGRSFEREAQRIFRWRWWRRNSKIERGTGSARSGPKSHVLVREQIQPQSQRRRRCSRRRSLGRRSRQVGSEGRPLGHGQVSGSGDDFARHRQIARPRHCLARHRQIARARNHIAVHWQVIRSRHGFTWHRQVVQGRPCGWLHLEGSSTKGADMVDPDRRNGRDHLLFLETFWANDLERRHGKPFAAILSSPCARRAGGLGLGLVLVHG